MSEVSGQSVSVTLCGKLFLLASSDLIIKLTKRRDGGSGEGGIRGGGIREREIGKKRV
jgi:hypothetical protein